MVLLLSDSDVTRAISMAEAVPLLEKAFLQHAAGSVKVMPRTSAEVPGNGGVFRVMSAILPDSGFFGLKSLTGYPGRRLPGETYFVVLLFSCDTGALRAIMAANRLTGIRTGAATGLAAKYLSRPDSRVLGIFGAGVQAWYQAAAMMEVRPIQQVRVFDVDRRKAALFANQIAADFNVSAVAVDQPQQTVTGVDLIVTITSARAPVFEGSWLEDGMHVTGAGSNAPAKRELDGVTFARSTIVVDFRDQVLDEAGDLQEAIRIGAISASDIHGELGEVVAGRRRGRTDNSEITLFKSVGMAVEDIATASFVYKQALVAGLGTRLELENLAPLPVASGLPDAAR